MAKAIKSKEELQDIIRNDANRREHCKDVYFGGIYWHELDEMGCNWSISTMSGSDTTACFNDMLSFAVALRSQYNIPDPD
ncbi:MAG: hypothetical protein ACAH12_03410 [Methylophilaceae bacterium]